MSYNLDIISLNQNKKTVLNNLKKIKLINEIDDKELGRSFIYRKTMSSFEGIWYSILDDRENSDCAFKVCDYDEKITIQEIPYWISEEDKESLNPIIIYDECFEDFKNVLEVLIKESPKKTIIFTSYYQGGRKEIIMGPISIKEFIEGIKNKKISFNVSYIITE